MKTMEPSKDLMILREQDKYLQINVLCTQDKQLPFSGLCGLCKTAKTQKSLKLVRQ